MFHARCWIRQAAVRVLLAALVLCVSVSAQAGDSPDGVLEARVDGAAIYYTDTGGEGPVLVLVHGWACDRTFWRDQVDGLSDRLRILALDLPGHGASELPQGPLSQDLMARSVLAVMDAAGVERAYLAGHSMGASVVRLAALAAPERVAGLVIVDGALIPGPRGEEETRAWEEEMAPFVDMFRGPDADANLVGFVESMRGTETTQELTDQVIARMQATPAEVRLAAMEEFLKPEVFTVGPVDAPTLAVFVVSPDTPPDYETALRSMFPNMEYHLWDGPGHFLMMERPGEFNDLVLDFVARHEAG